jgi:hypothetical protein
VDGENGGYNNRRSSDNSVENKHPTREEGYMPPEARRNLVLEFIDEHDMPLPPLAIWGGLNRQYRVTFSYRTLQNILSDLVDEGDVFRVDTTILKEEGRVEEVEDSSGRRAYYYITEEGRERVMSEDCSLN